LPARSASVPLEPIALPQPDLSNGGPSVEAVDKTTTTEDGDAAEDVGLLGSAVANKQWTVIQFPLNYLPSNRPIRVSADASVVCCEL